MNSSRKEKTFSISHLASEFDISPRSIRFYEEKGLLSPRRSSGNQRIYSKRDRARLKLILRGKRFGYSLEEIAEMIGMTVTEMHELDQINTSLAYGERKLKEIRERISELELMEQDLIAVREKLLKRSEELERGQQNESSAASGNERKEIRQ
jgi:DNA-binding transcriptional MerR regulator